jgi:ATP-binding cassette subfamily B protein
MRLPDLEGILRQTYILSHVGTDELSRLESLFTLDLFQPGDTLVQQGQPAGGWCIIRSGLVRTIDRSGAASTLGRGDTFGERSLLEAAPSEVTIRADAALTVLRLSPAALEAFLDRQPPGSREQLARRIAAKRDFDFLRRLRIFSHLEAAEVERLLDRVDRVSLEAGAALFREDEAADSCFVVRSGRVTLLKNVDGAKKQLALRRDGDLIGETELLYATPRIADAIAAGDTELFAFSRGLFDQLLPQGGAREVVLQLATERLLQYQNMLAEASDQAADDRLPSFPVRWVKVPGRLVSRVCPLVTVESPLAAGLACLAMIDAHVRHDGTWQDRVEQLLWERQPDTLTTLARKAEECGYFSRVITPDDRQVGRVCPAVIEDDDGSLAVLFAVDSGRVTVANPLRGVRTIDRREWRSRWNGRVMALAHGSRERLPGALRATAPLLAAAATAALLVQLFALGVPLATKVIVDRVLVDADLSMLRLLLVGVAALLVFQLAAMAMRDALLANAAGRMAFSLQRRFLNQVLRLAEGAVASQRVANLAVRFRENDALVERGFKAGLTLVVDSVAVIAYFAVLLAISRPMAAVAAAFVVAYGAVMAVAAPLMRRAGRKRLETREAVQSHVIESVSGIETIKALVAERQFLERGRRLILRVKREEFSAARLTFTIELLGSALHLAAVVAILAWGATLALAGHATAGDMVAALGVFGAALVPLNGLIEAPDSVREIRASLASLDEIYALPIEETPTTTVPPLVQGHVLFANASFRYPGSANDVLTDVTLDVLPGQRVAIVGRSGSGKTTLVNLLAGLYQPTGGSIHIDHVDIDRIPRAALRRQIGFVEQHPTVFSGTVRDNIALADPSAPLERVVAVATLAGAHEFIEGLPLGYETALGERGTVLSGGEKQRLMIARALLASPRLLILDEATSAVDSAAEQLIQQRIREAFAGRTTFVIAHRLSTIRDADLIVVLDQGRLVERGTHAELMARRGLYFYLNTRFA